MLNFLKASNLEKLELLKSKSTLMIFYEYMYTH